MVATIVEAPLDYFGKHGLKVGEVRPAGMGHINRVFMSERYVLRLGDEGSDHAREARLALAALERGIRTARPVAWGRNYSIWERLEGTSYRHTEVRASVPWSALLDDLEVLHAHPLEPKPQDFPKFWSAEVGVITETQGRAAWTKSERTLLLHALGEYPIRNPAFVHGDAYGDNVIVSPAGLYLGVIDWGCAGWQALEAEASRLEDGALELALERWQDLDLALLWKLRVDILLRVAALGRLSFASVRSAVRRLQLYCSP